MISNHINNNFINLFFNPDKINEINVFFKENNFQFDIIIDNNNDDYVTQIACFSILYSRVIKKYLIKFHEKYKKNTIYNIQKFTSNIIIKNNYLIVTK